jgi:hypothetical protein
MKSCNRYVFEREHNVVHVDFGREPDAPPEQELRRCEEPGDTRAPLAHQQGRSRTAHNRGKQSHG